MISFIGAGKVGSALGLYFKQKGMEIGGYYSRTYANAERAAMLTGSAAYASMEELLSNSKMVWITVSDDALPVLAGEIAQLDIPADIEAFVHTSGVHSRGVLQPLEEVGFKTYCAHPLMAFGEAMESAVQLSSAYFTVDGQLSGVLGSELNSMTDREIEVTTVHKGLLRNDSGDDDGDSNKYLIGFLNKLGNQTLQIDMGKKELYHGAASVLSNYLVTLLNVAYEMFAMAGMTRGEIKKATAPLLNSTLKNIEENEHMSNALTGAIKRGDGSTVAKHLVALQQNMPNKIELYKALGRETMAMLGDDRLKDMLD